MMLCGGFDGLVIGAISGDVTIATTLQMGGNTLNIGSGTIDMAGGQIQDSQNGAVLISGGLQVADGDFQMLTGGTLDMGGGLIDSIGEIWCTRPVAMTGLKGSAIPSLHTMLQIGSAPQLGATAARPVVFVSNETKGDWMVASGKEPIAVKYELLYEFYSATGQHFAICDFAEFLELNGADEEAVSEAQSAVTLQVASKTVVPLIPMTFAVVNALAGFPDTLTFASRQLRYISNRKFGFVSLRDVGKQMPNTTLEEMKHIIVDSFDMLSDAMPLSDEFIINVQQLLSLFDTMIEAEKQLIFIGGRVDARAAAADTVIATAAADGLQIITRLAETIDQMRKSNMTA
jgi:hypothetical protein